MRTRTLIPLSLLVGFTAAACTDETLGPTAAGGPLFNHFPGHEAGNHYELTLTAPAAWSGATLVTAAACGWESIVANGDDRTIRAGVQEVDTQGNDVRFQLQLAGVDGFADNPVCLGNVRDNGDWRDDLIIEYRQRGRNAPEVFVVWHFQDSSGESHDLRTGWTRIANEMTWDRILAGETVLVEGQATIRKGRSTVVSGVPFAFELTVERQGGGGDDPPPPGPETGTIAGTVTDAATGEGIQNATVSVSGTSLSTTTGTGGSYSIANVPVGERSVTASAAGFEPESRTVTVSGGETVTAEFALRAEEPGDPPVIVRFDVSTRTTGQWKRTDIEWTVSHGGGALSSVTSELLGGETILDSQTSQISGSLASGEHGLRTRSGGSAFTVRLTVRDAVGNEVSETRTVEY